MIFASFEWIRILFNQFQILTNNLATLKIQSPEQKIPRVYLTLHRFGAQGKVEEALSRPQLRIKISLRFPSLNLERLFRGIFLSPFGNLSRSSRSILFLYLPRASQKKLNSREAFQNELWGLFEQRVRRLIQPPSFTFCWLRAAA